MCKCGTKQTQLSQVTVQLIFCTLKRLFSSFDWKWKPSYCPTESEQAQLVVPLQRCKVTLTVAFWTWCKVTHSPNSPDFNSETDSWVTSTYYIVTFTNPLAAGICLWDAYFFPSGKVHHVPAFLMNLHSSVRNDSNLDNNFGWSFLDCNTSFRNYSPQTLDL